MNEHKEQVKQTSIENFMAKELDSVKIVVKNLLEKDERCRSDDKWLIIKALREMGFKIEVDYSQLNSMPSWESFTRCRRSLQAEHSELRGSEEVQELRNKCKEEFKSYFGKHENYSGEKQ